MKKALEVGGQSAEQNVWGTALCSRNINSFSETPSLSKVGAVVSHAKCQLATAAALETQKQVLCKVEVVILINELSQQRKCACFFVLLNFNTS
jgi:hypothetical protein